MCTGEGIDSVECLGQSVSGTGSACELINALYIQHHFFTTDCPSFLISQ